MLKSKWADSSLGNLPIDEWHRTHECQARTNKDTFIISWDSCLTGVMGPKVWSVANNGGGGGATTRDSNVYLWYLSQVAFPPSSLQATSESCKTAFSGWDTTSNSKISTWDVWCHPESLFVHYRPRVRPRSGSNRQLAPDFILLLSLSRNSWDWGRFCSLNQIVHAAMYVSRPRSTGGIVISGPGYWCLRPQVGLISTK